MKYYILLLLTASYYLTACTAKVSIPKMVDSIEFDESIDNVDFKLCHKVPFQYFNDSKGILYDGDKPAIEDTFFRQYTNMVIIGESGLIRVRFLVNCLGESDRFRLLGMDNNYNEKIFDSKISDQILNISKKLRGWKPMKKNGESVDYYQYLIFVINDGNLIKILP